MFTLINDFALLINDWAFKSSKFNFFPSRFCRLNTDPTNVLPVFSWKQHLNINIINNEDVKLKFNEDVKLKFAYSFLEFMKEKELNFTYSNMQFFPRGLMLQKFKRLLRYEQR
ncbi:hypothetical protein R3W88_008673 [Solanum pinnatisectum]|uniref:Translocon at the inner envelope membrane of chloroplasts 214 n=1 Tax=Solanum pinnatisectum TaxID=50273 RepID=A0AAV9MCD3_9SOLN|nr:hypothetical protein R3W88_008673 [Solanum pinnatisectum]